MSRTSPLTVRHVATNIVGFAHCATPASVLATLPTLRYAADPFVRAEQVGVVVVWPRATKSALTLIDQCDDAGTVQHVDAEEPGRPLTPPIHFKT